MDNEKVFQMPFKKLYDCYLKKAERKGRTRAELDELLHWMTGWDELPTQGSLRDFFEQAPMLSPAIEQITGIVCGVRVEAVEDPLMRQIRCMDKLVDELAKGKTMDKILRR